MLITSIGLQLKNNYNYMYSYSIPQALEKELIDER